MAASVVAIAVVAVVQAAPSDEVGSRDEVELPDASAAQVDPAIQTADLPAGLQLRPDDRRMPEVRCGEMVEPCLRWVHRAADGRAGTPRTFVVAALDRDLVIVQEHTRLLALDLDDGTVVWERPVAARRHIASRRGWVLDAPGVVAVVTDTGTRPQQLEVRRLSDGTVAWSSFAFDHVRDVWFHDGQLRVLGTSRTGATSSGLRSYEPESGIPAAQPQAADDGAADGSGEVVLRDGLLTYRPADGDGWRVAAGPGETVSLSAGHVLVEGWDQGVFEARWYARATGGQVGQLAPRDAVNRPRDVAPNARRQILASGEALVGRADDDGDLQVEVSRFGERVLVDDITDGAVLTLAPGRLLRRTAGTEISRGTLEVVDLDDRSSRTISDAGGALYTSADDAPDPTGRPLVDLETPLAPTSDTAVAVGTEGAWLIDLSSGEVFWRADAQVLPVETPSRDLLVWSGGVIRLDPAQAAEPSMRRPGINQPRGR